MEAPELRTLGCNGVLPLTRGGGLGFDAISRTGVVFHMLSSLDELGRTGFTAIGESADEAAARFHQAEATLMAAAHLAPLGAGASARSASVGPLPVASDQAVGSTL